MQSNQNTMVGSNDVSVLDDLKCVILKVIEIMCIDFMVCIENSER